MKNIETEYSIRHRFEMKKNNQKGIILSSSKILSENWIEKYTISFDEINKIERIPVDEVVIKNEISKTEFFERLILNIQSEDETTRIFASDILCDFIEFDSMDFDFKKLQKGITIVIQQLKKEKNIDAEHKLTESIFEFIWLEKMSNEEKKDLLIQLVAIDSIKICTYIEDEEYLKIPEVQNYVKRIKTIQQ